MMLGINKSRWFAANAASVNLESLAFEFHISAKYWSIMNSEFGILYFAWREGEKLNLLRGASHAYRDHIDKIYSETNHTNTKSLSLQEH